MTTPRLKNTAAAVLASCGLLLAGCNSIEAGGQPLPPTPSATAPPSVTPTPAVTKSAAQMAAEQKVVAFYKAQWSVLSGKSNNTGAVLKLLRNQAGGTTGFQQQQLKYINTVRGQGWTLRGTRPVEVLGSREGKKVAGRPQVLVDVCEDDTQWNAVDKKGNKVDITMPKAPYALTLSVQQWPDGRWYLVSSAARKGTCT